MHRPIIVAALTGASLLPLQTAFAHGYAGPHMFISTLLIDDPNVADEASLPTFMWLRQPGDNGPRSSAYSLNLDFGKRTTEDLGFSLADGYQWLHTPGTGPTRNWENLEATPKYKAFVSPEHEFMLSLGESREFGRSGATGATGAILGNDDASSTTPTVYWGNGFGDLPIGFLRPLALTDTQYLFGVGINYTAEAYALTVEAPIPGNKQTGSHLGGIAQFHPYSDDLFPRSLGKPIVSWWQ